MRSDRKSRWQRVRFPRRPCCSRSWASARRWPTGRSAGGGATRRSVRPQTSSSRTRVPERRNYMEFSWAHKCCELFTLDFVVALGNQFIYFPKPLIFRTENFRNAEMFQNSWKMVFYKISVSIDGCIVFNLIFLKQICMCLVHKMVVRIKPTKKITIFLQ